jgi:hypothetical protein
VPKERISACLIVQNEQERLPAALASVDFCDEIIVVDGGSTDRTVQIAREASARVIENRWPGFAAQRNVAIDAATSDWILEIDADERISPRLRASIETLLSAPPPDISMAVCALRNRFLNKPIGPSAKYPAYRRRIFRREAYAHDSSREVHEGLEPHERPVVLDGDLEHELASTLGEAMIDTWRYAQLESLHLEAPATAHPYAIGIVLRPTAKWLYRMIVEGGWRDGWRGLLKISLDTASDALVWALVLTRARRSPTTPTASPHDGAGSKAHFGRRRAGPVKIVALADGGRAARAATRWLAELRTQGADVALISTGNGAVSAEQRHSERPADPGAVASAPTIEDVPLRAVRRLGPLTVIRALEIETQLRTIDAVVPVGRRARLIHRLVPGILRPEIAGLDIDLDPARAIERASTEVTDRRSDRLH